MKPNYWTNFIIFGFIVLLFSYFRLTIINSHNVAYTYDQGRDFLAGARMITDKDPVFVGPTTGIGGLFHGVWWYYVTATSFLLLGSAPINYYYFLFIIHLITLILWYFTIKKIFGQTSATWSSAVIASAQYYVSSHTFAGNNILAIPAFTSFCIMLTALVKYSRSTLSLNKKLVIVFSIGLSAGFVAETELAFGLFLMPTLIALFTFSKEFRSFLLSRRSSITFVVGLIIPFVPRILFEIKNNFMQTQILLGFFTKPKLYNPKSYYEVLGERMLTFRGYIEQSLGSNYLLIVTLVALVIAVYFFFINPKLNDKYKLKSTKDSSIFSSMMINLLIVLSGLFVFSLVYRDPFWSNYYEGIQIGFLLLAVIVLKYIESFSKKAYFSLLLLVILSSAIISVERFSITYSWKTRLDGMKLQEDVVRYIVDYENKSGDKVFCARVFTPPVIPHTYDYLWLYHYLEKNSETPRYEYIKNKCWYIIEPEWKGYEFRQIEWKKANIPLNAVPIFSTHRLFNDIEVVRYEMNDSQ